jgi:hypothetical protein
MIKFATTNRKTFSSFESICTSGAGHPGTRLSKAGNGDNNFKLVVEFLFLFSIPPANLKFPPPIYHGGITPSFW